MLDNGDFVYLDQALPGVYWDAKYFSRDNFTGRQVDGYEVNRVVGSRALSRALQRAQERARQSNLELLLWDAYRPERAVRFFLNWAAGPEDFQTKERHYPRIDKSQMVELGYLAGRSGHSRGGSVDLTLCRRASGKPLDMGTDFDFMDPRSHHGAEGISAEAADNRALLRRMMEECGFVALEEEWWHYSLLQEPYPDTYFDFPIR